MVWDRRVGFLLPSQSCVHKTWRKNQTTLCSPVEENPLVRGTPGTRIPSDDGGISSSAGGNGKQLLPTREPDKIRLNPIRDRFNGGVIDADEVIRTYSRWVSEDEYLLLQRIEYGLSYKASVDWVPEYIAVKCSKRGNDVYQQRVSNSLSTLRKNLPDRTFFNENDRELQRKIRTKLVSVTLTYDTKRCSLQEAWERIGKEFDQWMKTLRKEFGGISIFRTWEAHKNGYPHVHAILLFHDSDFAVFRHKSSFRVSKKARFSHHWHSNIDVQAIANLKTAVSYLIKYITKELFSEKATLTRAMLWVFKKRCFSLSKDFVSKLARLDLVTMHNSPQRTLTRGSAGKFLWHFIGVFTKTQLKIEEEGWEIKIPKRIVKPILEYLEEKFKRKKNPKKKQKDKAQQTLPTS